MSAPCVAHALVRAASTLVSPTTGIPVPLAPAKDSNK
jgi:hypothetical protein